MRAHWLFNTSVSVDNPDYMACNVKPLAPVFVREPYCRHSAVLAPTTPVEPLLLSAIRGGSCWLSAEDLKAVCRSNKITATTGSGRANKKGVRSVLKVDWAQALVDKFFEAESDEEKSRMVHGIVGAAKQSVSEQNVKEVCENLFNLDEENKQAFSGLVEMTEKVRAQCLEKEITERLQANAGRGFLALATLSRPSNRSAKLFHGTLQFLAGPLVFHDCARAGFTYLKQTTTSYTKYI